MTPPPPPVWKDVNEAAIKWPKATPKTLEDLLNEAHELFHDEEQSYAFKAGFYYGLIQILEAERQSKKTS